MIAHNCSIFWLVLKILFKLFTFLCAAPQTNGAAATMFRQLSIIKLRIDIKEDDNYKYKYRYKYK